MPVITKVDYNPNDLDTEDDIDVLQSNLHEIFENHLENLKNKMEEDINKTNEDDSGEIG